MKTYIDKHFDKIIAAIALLIVTVSLTGMITIMSIDKEIEKEKAKFAQHEDQLYYQNKN